jgi:hypothetical protein
LARGSETLSLLQSEKDAESASEPRDAMTATQGCWSEQACHVLRVAFTPNGAAIADPIDQSDPWISNSSRDAAIQGFGIRRVFGSLEHERGAQCERGIRGAPAVAKGNRGFDDITPTALGAIPVHARAVVG